MIAIHYAGEVRYLTGRITTHVLPGWAACCSGDRARRIAEAGCNTYNRTAVTCKRCLSALAREDLREECGNCRDLCEPGATAPVRVPWSAVAARWCPSCVARGREAGVLATTRVGAP